MFASTKCTEVRSNATRFSFNCAGPMDLNIQTGLAVLELVDPASRPVLREPLRPDFVERDCLAVYTVETMPRDPRATKDAASSLSDLIFSRRVRC